MIWLFASILLTVSSAMFYASWKTTGSTAARIVCASAGTFVGLLSLIFFIFAYLVANEVGI